jgi:hypothetical protein
MPEQHLHQADLARRWRISQRTLERWRWLKQGPAYLRIGGRIIYRIQDIQTYEAARVKRPAVCSTSPDLT